MDLLQQFKQNIFKNFSIREGSVLLAVSGGMDSMVMSALFSKSGIKFGIAHCNFKLRGEDADKDESLVEEWALEKKIPFYKISFETQQKADEWKKGIQETARILRYEWLETVRKQNGYSKIATAHHANDNMETLLMNLFRGCGISGLHGIPATNGFIIRPLLFTQRDDISAYSKENNVPFREDASNASDDYLRNAVRRHIVPAVKEWFPDAVQQVNKGIRRFSEAEILYDKTIEKERKRLLEKRGNDFYVPVKKLIKAVPLETICYELFSPFGFSSVQLPQLMELLSAESGKYIASSSHRVIRSRDFLIITNIAETETDFLLVEGIPATVKTGQGQFSFSNTKKPEKISTDSGIACIDLEKIEFPLVLRKWKKGDYFYPLGMGMKKKKLSDFFIDQKVPLHLKEQAWVLESAKCIVWIAGMRLDERFKISNSTTDVLLIEFKNADE